MHYLTHTSLQLFSISEWRESVMDVKAEVSHRSYKIVIAFEFSQYVLAFLTKDLVAFPKWVFTRPTPPPEVHPGHNLDAPESNLPFLFFFVEWLARDWDKLLLDNRFAIAVVRDLVDTFHGIGLYSASEIFIIAGLWPGLRVCDLFTNPSRVARLLEAIYAFVHIAKRDFLANVIRPALHAGTVIAPTREQRKRFASQYLLAWAKEHMTTHPRFAERVRAFEAALDSDDEPRFDPFEPTYLAVAFTKAIHLAALIFGMDAESLRAAGITPSQMLDDPVTAFFRSKGLLDEPTHLAPYCPIVIPLQQFYAERASLKTHLYRVSRGPVWSVNRPPADIQEEHENVRASTLFAHIVDNTDDVAIGPLEYKGSARAFSNGHQTIVAVSNADRKALRGPGRAQFIKVLRAGIREKMGLGPKPGQRKRGLTEAEKRLAETTILEPDERVIGATWPNTTYISL
ncbi:hypothetical protein AURDEDRAFT_131465 [Auricularia subglabra TFB-10046 SS5]|uniref:Uncharacterized protein n=1 Tax=Auricularia subglabra (strain TFB-10046 / SS5) TaxID=717982 RepID=J0WPR8_AURST|nr:hypothetical protein AURDEDRAFT_131465 [Auricularia subglabra TFB-10046 SS5]